MHVFRKILITVPVALARFKRDSQFYKVYEIDPFTQGIQGLQLLIIGK